MKKNYFISSIVLFVVMAVLPLQAQNQIIVTEDNPKGIVIPLKGNEYIVEDGDFNFFGTISGRGQLIKSGPGALSLTGMTLCAGGTYIKDGTLSIGKDANLGPTNATVRMGTDETSATLRFGSDDIQLGADRNIILNTGGGTFDTNGNNATIESVIAGAGGLTKSESGVLTLIGDNTYEGSTSIAGGQFRLGGGTGNATSGSITGEIALSNNSALIFARSDMSEYNGLISGGGQVRKNEYGTIVLTGENTYTNGTTIAPGGTIQLGNGGTTGSINGDVDNNGTLVFNRSNNINIDGIISGSGNLVQQGTGTTILAGNNTYTGGTLISGGALQLGNCAASGGITGNVVDNGSLIFSRSDAQTFSGVISGTGSVVKQCTNVLTLDVANSYTGGTTLKQGSIVISDENALGSTIENGELAGHVRYDAVNDGDELTVYVDPSIHSLKNHFHVTTPTTITSTNVFQIDDDLTFSGITNKNTTNQNLGGAFYVGPGSKLDINVGRGGQNNIGLVFDDNKYGSTANDIYLDAYSILNLNISGTDKKAVGNAVFINSGINSKGSGSLFIEGAVTGAGRQGLLQIAADSWAPETTVTGAVLRLVKGATVYNSIYTQDYVTDLQGNGTIDVSGKPANYITIAGMLSPDAAIFTNRDDIIGKTERFATLTLTGGKTEMKNFTFRYDVADPASQGKTNDLVKFGSQDVSIEDGKIDFITLSGTALNSGRYLVFDSDAANYTDKYGTALTDATLDDVLSGKINGVAMTAGTPRIGYDFNFNNDPLQNQIWLDVNRNTLQVVWQGGSNYWTPNHWKSVQYNEDNGNLVYAGNFNNGDLATFDNNKGNATVTLGDDIFLSGLQVNTVVDNSTIVSIGIAGEYGITAKKNDPSIEGKYAKTDGSAAPNTQEFNTTGKLEISGVYDKGNETLTTLTLANTGENNFEEGIDIYTGKLKLSGEADRLGRYADNTSNAGLVTFKSSDNTGEQKREIEVELAQTLQNRFVVEEDAKNTFIIANENTEISGITNAAAIELEKNTNFTLQANKTANLSLENNATDVVIGESAQLTVDGAGNTIVKSGIQSAVGSLLNKNGAGTLQIEADSRVESTSVLDGTFRVTDNVTYGDDNTVLFEMDSNGTNSIAGGGTIKAKSLNIKNIISPDNLDAADTTNGSRYGTLTLEAVGASPSIIMNNFTMDFDLTTPTQLDGSGKPTNDQDLLVVTGAVVGSTGVNNNFTGRIDFRTESDVFGQGDYLAIQSSDGYNLSGNGIDGINTVGGALTATINGQNAANLINSPRKGIGLELRNDDKDIWLTNEMNSLTMDWTGGGDWGYNAARMKSLQDESGVHETYFMNGDKVHLAVTPAQTVNLADGVNPIVSGLVIGQNSNKTIQHGDIAITGKGGVKADASTAFGDYLLAGALDPKLNPTGKLQKYGNGALILSNTGENIFKEGVDLHNGTIELNEADRLGKYGATTGYDDAAQLTFKNNDPTFVAEDNTVKSVVVNTAQILQNRFVVEEKVTGATLTVNDEAEISGVESYGGAIVVNADAALTIDANADLTLLGNSHIDGTKINGDIYVKQAGVLNFNVADEKGVFIGSGINGDGTINIGGDGFVQVKAPSLFNGTTNIQSGGTLRVLTEVGEDNHIFNLNNNANFEGNGMINAGTANISGNISPDGMLKTQGDDEITGDERYATLTIKGNGSATTILNDFTFDYDIKAPNTENDLNTPNDLLDIIGMSTISLGTATGMAGTIHFQTDQENNITTVEPGKYLVVNAENSITLFNGETNPNSVLAGMINGAKLEQLSPRIGYNFRFNNTAVESSTANSQIWLDATLNSLTMDWSGGSAIWDNTNANFTSLQKSDADNISEKIFHNGDKVHFSGDTDYTVELDTDALVSGLVAGQNSDNIDQDINVTISGTGSITTKANSASGNYLNVATAEGQPLLVPTGKLEKHGIGIFTLANSGINTFEDGIDIYRGTLSFNNADQLNVGTGKGITFKDDAALQADATAALNSDIVLGTDVTATLSTADDITMTLNSKVSGTGNIVKAGEGTLFLNGENAYSGSTTIMEGTLDMASGVSLAGNMIIDPEGTLKVSGNTIAGAGQLQNNSHIVANVMDVSTVSLKFEGAVEVGTEASHRFNINVVSESIPAAGTYTLIEAENFDFTDKYIGTSSIDFGPNLRYGFATFDASTKGKLLLHVTGEDPNRKATWDSGSGTWDEVANSWTLDGESLYKTFKNNDWVKFENSDEADNTIEVSATGGSTDIIVQGMAVYGDNNWTFTDHNIIGIAIAPNDKADFIMNGNGVVTFENDTKFDTYKVNSGTLRTTTDGKLEGNVVIEENATLSVGYNVEIDGELNLGNGSILTIDMTDGMANNTVLNASSISSSDKFNINIINVSENPGTYTLIEDESGAFDFTEKFTATINGTTPPFVINDDRYTLFDFDTSVAGKLTLVVVSDIARTATWDGGSGTWDETNDNWTLEGLSQKTFKNNDWVEFNDSDETDNTIEVSATGVVVQGLNIFGDNNWTFTGFDITGIAVAPNDKADFVMDGNGVVAFKNDTKFDTYQINSGTLKIATGAILDGDVMIEEDVTLSVGYSVEINGELNLGNESILTIDMTDATANNTGLSVSSINSSDKFNINIVNVSENPGTYTLIEDESGTFDFTEKFTATINGTTPPFVINDDRYTLFDFDTSIAGKLTLVVVSDITRTATWDGGSGTWDEVGNSWTLDGESLQKTFKNNDWVKFENSDETDNTIEVSATGVVVQGMNIFGDNNWTFTGFDITGIAVAPNDKADFVMDGSGVVAFENDTKFDTYQINSGTLKIATNGKLEGNVVINEGAMLSVSHSAKIDGKLSLDNQSVLTLDMTDATANNTILNASSINLSDRLNIDIVNLLNNPGTYTLIEDESGTLDFTEKFTATIDGQNISRNISFDTSIPGKLSVTVKLFTEARDIQIYPNPTKERLYINTDSDVLQVTVHNLSGTELHRKTNGEKSIDMSALSTGSYLVKIRITNGEITRIVIKE